MLGKHAPKKRLKVGLALGGGAARGLAHIGVLEILYRAGVPVDIITGTSAGAIFGALYACGMKPARIRRMVQDEMDLFRLGRLFDITLGKAGLIRGRKVVKVLEKVFGGDIDFTELTTPFACVATDLNNGEEVIMRQGSVLSAVRASISIPGIFTPVRRDDRVLVDGGLRNPVPVDVARAMGADFVIAVNVIPSGAKSPVKGQENPEMPVVTKTVFSVLLQSVYIMSLPMINRSLQAADFTIQPEVGYIGAEEFHRVKEFIVQGELAAEENLPLLKQRLRAVSTTVA
jgi:NTE family protein